MKKVLRDYLGLGLFVIVFVGGVIACYLSDCYYNTDQYENKTVEVAKGE